VLHRRSSESQRLMTEARSFINNVSNFSKGGPTISINKPHNLVSVTVTQRAAAATSSGIFN
jgi:hypothetical protein